jgi:DNA-binding FadR family transcriptional regulator
MGSSRDEIAGQLREKIISGEYRPGAKLPSYRQLAEMYGAVPNTAGAAVRVLASEGLVTVNDKSPAVVRSLDDASRTPEVRLSAAKGDLLDIQEAVRDARRQLGELEQRVSAALSNLDA